MLTVEQRVANGIAHLKQWAPSFKKKIDTKKLDVRSDTDCPLGQLYGSYYNARLLGIVKDFQNASDMGFQWQYEDPELLNAEWRKQLSKED